MRISPRWRKVLRELWKNKTRTLLVILSIAIGVFAVGLVLNARYILIQDMNTSYQVVNPSSAVIFTNPPFDEELVFAVENMPEVVAVDARRRVFLRFETAPNEWENLEVYALADYNEIDTNLITPVQGAWPPPDREILIERASLNFVDKALGEPIKVRTSEGLERALPIAGTVYDINQVSAEIRGRAYGYVTFDTLEWLDYPRTFEQLHIIVAGDQTDQDHIEDIVDVVSDKIENLGYDVNEVYISPNPGQHPEISVIQAIVLVLGALGVLSLFSSMFLLTNTITAILTQQIREIGVIKAIGGTTKQIVVMYLCMILVFCIGALILGVPLAAYAARIASGYVGQLINFDILTYSYPNNVLIVQLTIGLLVPLLAALSPIYAGTRITIREAISSYGITEGSDFGNSIIDKLISNIRSLSRPLLLSLRNTFRRKGRLVLTLTALTLSGALFMAIFTVRASTLKTLDVASQYWGYDVEVTLQQSQRIDKLNDVLPKIGGIETAESWIIERARRLRTNNREGNDFIVIGLYENTSLLQPTLIEGRWLQPDDKNAIVINSLLLKFEPDLKVGDTITLKMEQRETRWEIVGLLNGPLTEPTAYTSFDDLSQALRQVNKANRLQIVTTNHSPEFQDSVKNQLEQYLPSQNLNVETSETITDKKERLTNEFTPIIIFLSIMAALLAFVGALGLIGTMTINVLERTKEIGILRSIGASNGVIRQIVIIEGVIISIISWGFGVIFALPISWVISEQVGLALLEAPLTYRFSIAGVFMWLFTIILLSIIATLLPAHRASSISIHETLAYE